MKLFITDDLALYNNDNTTFKLLFMNHHIMESEGFDKALIERLNYLNNDIDYQAAEIMFVELDDLVDRFSDFELGGNRYIKTRSKRDEAFTLLYPFASNYLLSKNIFLITIKNLFILNDGLVFSETFINLSDVYKFAEFDLKTSAKLGRVSTIFREGRTSIKLKLIKFIKNNLYQVYNLLFSIFFFYLKKDTRNKRHMLLFMYDGIPDFKLFETFFEVIKVNPKCYLSIVQIESGIEKKHTIDAKYLKGKNISTYKLQDFRKGNFINYNTFYGVLNKVNKDYDLYRKSGSLEDANLHYEWINNAFEKLKPDVCMYHKLVETGRRISDVTRYHKIPSVYLQYALSFDTPFLNQNIHFTARACINELSVHHWKKYNDPSDLHPIIGFCKLDSLSKVKFDKNLFFKTHHFDLKNKTILFASTWSAENKIFDKEKREIVKQLSELCKENNWNLIIKKHPSEFDDTVDKVFLSNPVENQKVFLHEELHLAEAILISDFFCCQSSSAILEAIYFGKPFCFLSLAQAESDSKYHDADINELVPSFFDIPSFEEFVNAVFDSKDNTFSMETFDKLRDRYLFKSDGLASQRLFDILMDIKYIESI